jgi:hypothetical protein
MDSAVEEAGKPRKQGWDRDRHPPPPPPPPQKKKKRKRKKTRMGQGKLNKFRVCILNGGVE